MFRHLPRLTAHIALRTSEKFQAPFRRRRTLSTQPPSKLSVPTSATAAPVAPRGKKRLAKVESAATDGIPGLRYKDFENLATGQNKDHKEYPRRWDWHLRWFIYGCQPPFILWVFTVVIEQTIMKDPDVIELLQDFREADLEVRQMPEVMDKIRKTMEDRVADLEKELAEMKAAKSKQDELALLVADHGDRPEVLIGIARQVASSMRSRSPPSDKEGERTKEE